jgi:putative redox protein
MSKHKEAVLRLTDGMHFEAETGSGRRFAYDDPPEGGLGPVETVLASLAACSAMDVISIALKKRQDVDAYTIRVAGDQRDAYPQVYTRIDVVHEVDGRDIDEAAIRRCIELSATKYCPVNAMLSAGATEVHHGYRIRSTGARPYDAQGEVLVTGPYRRPDVVA